MSTKRLLRALLVLLSLAAVTVSGKTRSEDQAGSGCAAGLNAIVCENFQTGAPASEWDVAGSGDASIQGYATEMSVDQGETVRFKINTNATSYRLDVYRLGYYGGLGARKVTTVTPSAALPQSQPACLTVAATGLVDCGNWAESASWTVPADAVSGIYFAKLVRADTGGASHVVFVVRDDDGRSELLFQTSDTTWQAYNSYGGNSLYTGAPVGRAYKVSYNRPFNTRGATGGPRETWLFNSEYPMVRWLEANGYDVSYFTGIDSDRRGAEILEHKVFLSVGHDEYWSGQQRTNVEAARNAGTHLTFFSGNEVFWKTRWENDTSGRSHRTLVCYKETHANAKIDPTAEWTGTWRDPRFSPPSDGGRPENALTGTLFMVNGVRNDALSVPEPEGKARFWRNTTIAALQPGQTATLPAGTLGYEWAADPDNGSRPPGLIRLSSTTLDVTPLFLLDYGSTYGPGVATHNLTLYRHGSGALVFGAGTVQWAWGLDPVHDRAGTPSDVRMQQATVNLLADMGAQPQSLRAGLVGAAQSTDTLAPTSTITAPPHGATVQGGVPMTISGTAADAGGGLVAAVEVSHDGGLTWHPATGRANWSYPWTPFTPGSSAGSATLLSRAVDDSGNIETPGIAITVTIQPGPGLVAAYGFEEASGTVAADRSGNTNNGSIQGATWSTSGRFGSALSFDGVDDIVTIADAASLDLTSGMTLEAWVFPRVLSGWRSAVLKESSNGLVYGLYAHDDVPRPAGYVRVGNTEPSAAGVVPVPTAAWTHLATTYDGARLRLYVNGVEVSSTVVTGNITTSNSPLRLGANAVWGEHFDGLIDEVRVYARALPAAEIQADMGAPVGGSPLPDTVAPTVSITAPSSGAIVNGTLAVTADAADDRSVAGVQFLLDGAPLGTEDLAAPYSVTWDSTQVSDGVHRLTARARDAAGNTTLSGEVSVAVANTPDSTPPVVTITAPAEGATVTGTVGVTANASDNVAVAGVQFLLDGVALGAEDTSAPYSAAWNTSLTPNGAHALTARARDASTNQATSTAVSVTVSNAPPPSGLVAAYSFSEGTGTTAGDVSANGRTGTISGATWTSSGRFDSALSFDGVNDWITIADANALDLTTGMTLEAWVNPTVLSGWRTVIMKEISGGLAYGLYGHDNAPYPAVTVNVGGDQSALGTSPLPTGAWSHLAATYDGAVLRLFVNGVQVSSRSLTGSMAVSTSPLRIGGNLAWGEYFHGLIDEVRIFNRARTTAEIQSDMNTPVEGTAIDTVPDTLPPSTPAALTAAGSLGAATLAWNASTDNTGVARYNVHRATTQGFTPSIANRIAQPVSAGYVDAGLAAGTYYYRVTAQDSAGNVSDPSNEASAAVTADTTSPTVSISAPVSGSTVAGIVTVSANASDAGGVAGVSFLLDGAPLGVEDTSAPYTVSWNTSQSVNGAHTLSARARDQAGNQTTSAPVSVTVSNTGVPGLVAAYGFSEGSGTTTADASGNSFTGSISGAAWSVSGRFGSALSFDGADDWITVPDANALDLTTGMTLEAWVNPSTLSGWRTALLKEAPGALSYALYAHDNAPRPAATVNIGSIDRSALGATALPLNVWSHLAATYDGTTLRIFVNGVQVGTHTISGPLVTSAGVLRIGGNAVWGEYFGGLIDEVRVYNRALTAAEIQNDMNLPVNGS